MSRAARDDSVEGEATFDLLLLIVKEMKPVVIELSPVANSTNCQYTFRMVATAYPDGNVDAPSDKADEFNAKITRVAKN